MMLLMRMGQPTVKLSKDMFREKEEEWVAFGKNGWQLSVEWGLDIWMRGALAQALLSQQLQHREAMTSCQEQRFELEERPLAVLVRNSI